MIKTIIIKQIADGEKVYHIGDYVRVKMKPKNAERPQQYSEFIGEIVDIQDDLLLLSCSIDKYTKDTTEIIVSNIERMRFADKNETFDTHFYF